MSNKRTTPGDPATPRRTPMGGWRNYPDCHGGLSTMCLRPDCVRCHEGAYEQRRSLYLRLLAVVEHLRRGNPMTPAAQRIVDHFDPTKNGNASITREEVEAEAAGLNE